MGVARVVAGGESVSDDDRTRTQCVEEVDVDNLGAIWEDVPFDWDGLDSLVEALEELEGILQGQIEGRIGLLEAMLAEDGCYWRGGYAELFVGRCDQSLGEAGLLAEALDWAVLELKMMRSLAETEQERREQAREWQLAHEAYENDRNMFETFWDWVSGTDADPPPAPPPPVLPPEVEARLVEIAERESAGVSPGSF